jgi:hypothetical protein
MVASTGDLFGAAPINAVVHHQRRGVKSDRMFQQLGYYSGKKTRRYVPSQVAGYVPTATFAPFNSEADARRAIVRGKRWLRNQSKGPLHVPPSHIYANAEHAVAQFGKHIAD